MKIKTVNNIEVLLHCYFSPDPHPRLDAPAVRGAISMFLNAGAIQPAPISGGEVTRFTTTPLGAAWIKALCNVGCPQIAFVDDAGEVIK